MAGTGKVHLRTSDMVISIEDLVVEYKLANGRRLQAVSGISLDIGRGETVGLVGESGCGKSTLAKALMQLPPQTSGSIRVEGTELKELTPKQLRETRPAMQLVFQDPISSLNPRRKVKDIIAEGLVVAGVPREERERRVAQMIRTVGLDPDTAPDRRPHEFSGGQCQRISIARAMVMEPTILICDEPVSALDVSLQAQIMNLLEDMKDRYGLSMLFIAHDLAVVKNVSDRIVVMYLGKICEVASPDTLFADPAHPYTRGLIASIPEPDPDALDPEPKLIGDLPSPMDPPSGCRFRTRCPLAQEKCASEEPQLRDFGGGHFAACHFPIGGSDSGRRAIAHTAINPAVTGGNP